MSQLNLVIHQTKHAIGDFENIEAYLKNIIEKQKQPEDEKINTLHIFPELFLTGYPLQDLCLQRFFITKYLDSLNKICDFIKKLPKNPHKMFLMGALQYDYSEEEKLPLSIKNSILMAIPGETPQFVYDKMLLPSYDIFDETKYFTPGKSPTVLDFNGNHIALQICEDMWSSAVYDVDPVESLSLLKEREGKKIDLIINLSASPYAINKSKLRINRALEISNKLEAPFAYVNRVGGEDEIIFDGHSFVVDGKNITHELSSFSPSSSQLVVPAFNKSGETNLKESNVLNGKEFLTPRFNIKKENPRLSLLSDNECQEIIDTLIFGLQEYSHKCGLKNFLVALSGGIDSALVLALTKLGLKEGQDLEAIYMPSKFSAAISYDLSLELSKNLGIKLHYMPIKFLHSSVQNLFKETFKFPLAGLADENVQSRLRGNLLYTYSNAKGQMVINTSNKSELAVGYSTLYGDSVGALSLLGDLYKSEVFQLANYINRQYNAIIPNEIITRPPSAELRDHQKDEDSLPPYEQLDVVLEGLLSYRMNKHDLVDLGINEETVTKVMKLIHLSEYKRRQFCPIIKLRAKSFGFGYRIPITKKMNI